MTATIDASEVLRPGLLAGVSMLIAGAQPPGADAGESLAAAVAATCTGLGAEVARWEPGVPAPALDMLVFDGAAVFTRGQAHDRQPPARTPRSALGACLDAAWEATHDLVSESLLPAARPARIVYLAPAPSAGANAEPARAGLENLARTLSIEWARFGITTVAIAPGTHSTGGEVAALVAYLASPAGAYFSGALLDLRGPAAA